MWTLGDECGRGHRSSIAAPSRWRRAATGLDAGNRGQAGRGCSRRRRGCGHDADEVFALFFEANGLAAAGHEPYATVVPQLVQAWLAWAAEHLQGPPGLRRAEAAAALRHARYALWKNPGNLTARQRAKLDWVATTDPLLHRAYLLKEGLRTVFEIGHGEGPDAGIEALDRWLAWARH